MGGADRVDLIEVAYFHCGKPFDVCIRDYRGQRYCEKDCRELGYRSRGREAGRRYQRTPEGRERHRRRQQAFRERRGVTHGATGEAPSAGDTVSPDASETARSANEEVPDESIWLGAALAALALAASSAPTPFAAVGFIAAAMFGIQVKSSSLFTVPVDLYPARSVALAWGLQGAAGSLGGMLFQLYIGRIVDGVGYAPVFWAVSGMHLFSAALVTVIIPRIEPPGALPKTASLESHEVARGIDRR